MKKYLFIIDPQNDFTEGGALPVNGGKKALENIVTSGILDEDWEKIFVTLDTHHPSNLGFGEPKSEQLKKIYGNQSKFLDQWPPHCLKDTHGWEIYGPLWDALKDKINVTYILKGESDTQDMYSAFTDGHNTVCLWEIEDNSELYFSGLAEDYCVRETIKDVMNYCGEGYKYYLLQDMTAPINSREKVDEMYNSLPKRWEKKN